MNWKSHFVVLMFLTCTCLWPGNYLTSLLGSSTVHCVLHLLICFSVWHQRWGLSVPKSVVLILMLLTYQKSEQTMNPSRVHSQLNSYFLCNGFEWCKYSFHYTALAPLFPIFIFKRCEEDVHLPSMKLLCYFETFVCKNVLSSIWSLLLKFLKHWVAFTIFLLLCEI